MAAGWTDDELAASVDAYRSMEASEATGKPYSKKQIYRDLAARFDRSEKAFEYRMQNISAVLDELGLPWVPGLKPAGNVGEGMKPRLIALIKEQQLPPKGQFKHGNKRTWELALDAIDALGGRAETQEVLRWIAKRYPDYNKKNAVDLFMLSVNSPTRTSYLQNSKPRRTDQGSEFDRLFKVGEGPGVTYVLYDPAIHGVWEIYPDSTAGNKFGMGVRRVVEPIAAALTDAVHEAEQAGAFDAKNVEDARRRVMAGIVRRQGQPAFRKALLEAYDGKCAITGCSVTAILEAAHIHPYMGDHTNVVSNGLLLRADIHTLFDLKLVAIDPVAGLVEIAPALLGTEYGALNGRPLPCPLSNLSVDALAWHRGHCAW